MANRVNVDLGLNVQGYQQGLNQAIESTEKYETEVRKVKDSTVNFNKEFAKAKKEAKNLAVSFAMLSKEEKKSQFGREMAKQLEEAKEKAAQFLDISKDIGEELKNRASDTRFLDTMSEGMGVLADATAGAMGVIAQFTGDEKDAQRAVVAFTTAQSVLGTVTKIQNALQMQSNTMLAVAKVQTLAAAAAERIKTAATEKGVVATKAATVAQRIFNVVANANPYVLLATAVLTVVSALAAFTIFSGKSAAAQEHENKMTERAERINNSYYDALNTELSNTIPKYIKLQTEWQNLRTEGEKLQWIKDNQDEFNSLGIEITTVEEAENALIANTDKVVEAFERRAIAMAMQQKAAEIYKQYLDDMQWLQEHMNDTTLKSDELAEHGFNTDFTRKTGNGGWLGWGHGRYAITDAKAMGDQRKADADTDIRNMYKGAMEEQEKGEKALADAGVKEIKEGDKKKNNARAKGAKNTKKEIHKNSIEEAEEAVKVWEEVLRQVNIDQPQFVKQAQDGLAAAKKELERRKTVLGIDVKIKNSSDLLKDYENALKDAASNAEAAMVLASVNGEIDKVDELTEQWELASQALKNYQATKKLLTEGIEISGNADLSKSLKGDFPATIQGYSNAISTLQQKLQETNWGSMGEEGSRTFQEYIDLIQQYKAELQNLNEIYEDAMLTPQEKAQKKAEKTAEAITSIGNAAQAAGDLFSALGERSEDVGLQKAGIVAKAIATITLSFAQAMTSCKTWVDWLAFGLSGMGTLVSMVNQMKSLNSGSYATGGIIGGSSYFGDKITANVNSGEMILNKHQQRNLFDAIDKNKIGNSTQNVRVTGVIRGKDIMLVQKNTNDIRGRAGSSITF